MNVNNVYFENWEQLLKYLRLINDLITLTSISSFNFTPFVLSFLQVLMSDRE